MIFPRSVTAFAVTVLMLASAVSCGSTEEPVISDAGTVDTATVTEAVEEELGYPYETPDMNGYSLRVLNTDDLWSFFTAVDTDQMTGEILNDAVFNRNRTVESLLNCQINVTQVASNGGLDNINNEVKKLILAADDAYDVMYSCIDKMMSMVAEGYYYDLLTIPGLHVNEEWWDKTVTDNVTLNGSLYFASSPMQLMPLQGTWCLFFNETMMNANDMALPYDLVREGKWTVDQFYTYTKAITNLNGDADYKWSPDGNAVYGLSIHIESGRMFLRGCNEFYIDRDKDGLPVFAAEDTRFLDVLEKLGTVLDTTAGLTFHGSDDDFNVNAGGYVYTFSADRALFLSAQMKVAQELRDMEDTFGIVPYPKYDENQTAYTSYLGTGLFYTIPVTASHLTETAVISDVLSWQSWKDVLPVYYGKVVEQKGLRNENSVEMMRLIRDTSTLDLALMYGWTTDLDQKLRTNLYAGKGDFASTIAKQRAASESKIQKTLDAVSAAQ